MNEHDKNLNLLMDLENIKTILNIGNVKVNSNYLKHKYKKASIDEILSIKDTSETYDLVCANFILKEDSKVANKLLDINSKYFLIYDLKENNYIEKLIKENDFQYIDYISFNNNCVAYLVKRLDIVDITYKYINEFIDSNKLLIKLENLRLSLYSSKHQKDIKNLISNIKTILEEKEDYAKILELVVNNEAYLDLARNMSSQDLLVMITGYINVPKVPKIDQELFDQMVELGIKYNQNEKLWRLAFNYEHSNMDFSAIEDYYLKTKNDWYLSELIYAVGESMDLKELVNKLISTKDKIFIKSILYDHKNTDIFSKEDIEALEKYIS